MRTANYDFYGVGHDGGEGDPFLPISQSGSLFLVEPKVRVFEHVFVGPRYRRLYTTVEIDLDGLLDESTPGLEGRPEIPPRDVEATVASLGLRVQRDSRDSQFYPRAGGFTDATLDFAAPTFGSDREFDSYEIAHQGYHGIGDENVIAYRAAVCAVSGDAPFYGLCKLGNSKDIRGYAVGVYQDRRMAVGQVEYRRELPWRLGLTAFFGLGQVADTFDDFNGEDVLPGGVGVRFTLAEQNHINLRVDYAWGRDSSALYVGLLEAF